MLKIIPQSEFKRDIRKAQRRGKNLSKLYRLAESLAKGEVWQLNIERTHLRGIGNQNRNITLNQIGC